MIDNSNNDKRVQCVYITIVEYTLMDLFPLYIHFLNTTIIVFTKKIQKF